MMLILKLLPLLAALAAANPLAAYFAPLTERSKSYTKDSNLTISPGY